MKFIFNHLQNYYGVYLLIIAVVFLVLWFPNRGVNRYAISDGQLIDTRTGQIWIRSLHKEINFGTPDKPVYEISEEIRPVRKKSKPIDCLPTGGIKPSVSDGPELCVPGGLEAEPLHKGERDSILIESAQQNKHN
jgi:hypothetical protein